MDKIIEGNKLIAEFMGGIYYSDTNLFVFVKSCQFAKPKRYKPETLKFHNSWDWLMPVIDKLKEVIEEPEDLDSLKDVLWWGDISNVFHEVVDVIKYYNTQNQ